MSRPYLRLLRASDLPVIKWQSGKHTGDVLLGRSCMQALHRELFGFDIVVGDAALVDAVTSPRWTCLASVQVQPGGAEVMAGFVLAAIGSLAEFEQGDYSGTHSQEEGLDGVASTSSEQTSPPASSTAASSMGLHHLKLNPDDVVSNVCLLATLPQFRRQGVASSLFSQVISSARNARAKAIFLHVLTNNTPAIRFYQRLGFKTAATIPGFYQLAEPSTSRPAEELQPQQLAAGSGDALLLTVAMSDVTSPSSHQGAAYTTTSAARPVRPAAAAAASNSTAAAAAAKPVAPKMRGLMGGSSSSSSLSRRRPSQPAAPKPAATSTSTSTSPSGFLSSLFGSGGADTAKKQQPDPAPTSAQPQSAQPVKDTTAKGPSMPGVLGALTGVLGLGGKSAAAQPAAPAIPAPKPVEINGEKMLVVEGSDGEVYLRQPDDDSVTATDSQLMDAQAGSTSSGSGSSSLQGSSSADQEGGTGTVSAQGAPVQSGLSVLFARKARDVSSQALPGLQRRGPVLQHISYTKAPPCARRVGRAASAHGCTGVARRPVAFIR